MSSYYFYNYPNGTIDSGDWVSLDIGAVTGTVTQLTVTVTYTADAQ